MKNQLKNATNQFKCRVLKKHRKSHVTVGPGTLQSSILGSFGDVWAPLGRSWVPVGAVSGHLRVLLVGSWSFVGRLGSDSSPQKTVHWQTSAQSKIGRFGIML